MSHNDSADRKTDKTTNQSAKEVITIAIHLVLFILYYEITIHTRERGDQ